MKKKEIRIQTWSPIAYGIEQYSADIWISYHDRRKVVRECPLIFGIESAKFDILEYEHCIEHASNEKIKAQFEEENRIIKNGIEKVAESGYICLLDDILVNEKFVTKEVVEKCLTLYLRDKGFKSEFSFRWNKPKDVIFAMN